MTLGLYWALSKKFKKSSKDRGIGMNNYMLC